MRPRMKGKADTPLFSCMSVMARAALSPSLVVSTRHLER